MENHKFETRTYTGEVGTRAFDGFAGFRIGQRYIGVAQTDGRVLISIVGTQPGRGGVLLRAEEWGKWFEN